MCFPLNAHPVLHQEYQFVPFHAYFPLAYVKIYLFLFLFILSNEQNLKICQRVIVFSIGINTKTPLVTFL